MIWIDVNEKLPETKLSQNQNYSTSKHYLIFTEDNYITVAYYEEMYSFPEKIGWYQIIPFGVSCCYPLRSKVTHWAELPKRPN